MVMAIETTTPLMQVWLFWVAPIIGGVIAAVVWKYILE
jgi:glycerol uptake facilitator-like aquaporin